MGQVTSSTASSTSSKTVTHDELLKLFSKSCRKQFQPIEMLSIRQNMKYHDKDHNELISEIEFQELINLPDNSRLLHLIYNSLKTLSNFPLIDHDLKGINFEGLLNCIVLLNPERFGKVLTRDYEYLKLVFISFAIESAAKNKEKFQTQPNTETLTILNGTIIAWLETPSVSNFDGIDINQLTIPASDALELVAFLLIVSRLEPQESLKLYSEPFSRFDQYKGNALSIIRSMNPQITSKTLNTSTITYDQFSSVIANTAPNLLNPLSNLLEILLYGLQDSKENEGEGTKAPTKQIKAHLKLVNDCFLAQLSTFLPKQLVYSNIRKLYAGSDSGFSMRSFESKVFKWNAPTILIISGSRINHEKTKNVRYKNNFSTEFPKLKNPQLDFQKDGEIIVYGVYIQQPWKITNKDTFGNSHTQIFQISPIQKIFKSSISAKNFTYFNTLGGGIGVGSVQPTIKTNSKRYNPGNVSLTIDSTLEFAVFRHLGLGGEFKSTNDKDFELEYEDRFLIKDVEVWGCGGEKELAEQNNQWEWEQKEAKRRQQVNFKSIGEDRAILEMAGLVGQNQSGGSI